MQQPAPQLAGVRLVSHTPLGFVAGDLQRAAAACFSISAVSLIAGRMRISATSWETISQKWLIQSAAKF